ncbi:hypothetical protein [Bosea caraganae]|uniref:hypothetical protein n=1 Tax=Bosea caraganae TaxID=2763117 RepID=UPI0011C064FA|nr:hypothetical protein [Bosea caraganae]
MKDGHGNPLSTEQEAEIQSMRAKQPAQADAAGQYARSQAQPNDGGLVSANPVGLSGDGDATAGNGRDREPPEEL